MKKLFILTIVALLVQFASFAQGTMSGPRYACTGTWVHFYDSTMITGTWSSSNTSVATIDSTGATYALSTGVTVISYTTGSFVDTLMLYVYASPAAISGPSTVCVGATITLTDATTGGTWSSSSTAIATAGLSTGIVTGVAGGSVNIYYTTGGGCRSTKAITVGSSTFIDSILGPSSVCVGSTINMYDSTAGGVWTSSATSVATINPTTGVVTGVAAGTTSIVYTVTSSCGGTISTSRTISVITGSSAGTISGPTTVVAGSNITLTDGISGGSWTSGSTGVATINASTGVVTGIAAGVTVITYSVMACGTTTSTTYTVTVTAFDGIAGNVYFSHGSYYGSVKVWLINYNPSTHMLTAIDSQSITCSGATSVAYSFPGLGTDSFRVKAATTDSMLLGGTGYIPTYHDSAFYWFNANVIYHTSGTADAGKNIYMDYGTTTAGAGFIAGDVTTGANRGTSTTYAVGMIVFLTDASNREIASTYTNSTGAYTFSNLPVGSYKVHPEAINYMTTDYDAITLTSAHPNLSAASFVQHTVSKTITPTRVAVNNVNANTNSIVAFPNPTSGKLNINWSVASNETATIVIADITGREVYKSNVDMNAGNGSISIDLSNINNGLYVMSVKSASINYNNKIQVQH